MDCRNIVDVLGCQNDLCAIYRSDVFSGVAFTLGTFYFSSSGGAMSRFYTSQVSAQTGIIHERERFKVKLGPVFIASLLFFLIGLVFFILLVTGIIPPQKV